MALRQIGMMVGFEGVCEDSFCQKQGKDNLKVLFFFERSDVSIFAAISLGFPDIQVLGHSTSILAQADLSIPPGALEELFGSTPVQLTGVYTKGFVLRINPCGCVRSVGILDLRKCWMWHTLICSVKPLPRPTLRTFPC